MNSCARIKLVDHIVKIPSRTLWNRPKKLDSIAPNSSRVKFKKREAFKERFNELRGQEKLATVVRVPKKYSNYDEEFAKVTSFESQMQSLKFRGFQRPYRQYIPGQDMERKFIQTCQEVLGKDVVGDDLTKVKLEGIEKCSILSALAEKFDDHRVPNSLIHTMTTLDKVFTFYSTSVDMLSPYDRLELGVQNELLPQNLHVQVEPVRFDPDTASNDLGRITAYSKHSTILVTPEAQKKWKPFTPKDSFGVPQSPYKNSKDDDE